jgi:hypothetical protein
VTNAYQELQKSSQRPQKNFRQMGIDEFERDLEKKIEQERESER